MKPAQCETEGQTAHGEPVQCETEGQTAHCEPASFVREPVHFAGSSALTHLKSRLNRRVRRDRLAQTGLCETEG